MSGFIQCVVLVILGEYMWLNVRHREDVEVFLKGYSLSEMVENTGIGNDVRTPFNRTPSGSVSIDSSRERQLLLFGRRFLSFFRLSCRFIDV